MEPSLTETRRALLTTLNAYITAHLWFSDDVYHREYDDGYVAIFGPDRLVYLDYTWRNGHLAEELAERIIQARSWAALSEWPPEAVREDPRY